MENKILKIENAKQQIINELQKRLIFADVWDFVDCIVIDLSWEDWKVHCAVKNILSNNGYDYEYVVTESNESDCFSARYAVSCVA